VNVDHSLYIQKLRDRQVRKAAERAMPERMRQIALEPVIQFAESLAQAGEISGYKSIDDRFACSILVCSNMRNLLSAGGSIQITCNYAHLARTAGCTFWGLAVEALGCKPRYFNGSGDYCEVFNYLVVCITEQKLAVMSEA